MGALFLFLFLNHYVMSKQKQLFQEEGGAPTNPQRHLPFWLPVVAAKHKKKCCKKYKKGKRCRSCPNA